MWQCDQMSFLNQNRNNIYWNITDLPLGVSLRELSAVGPVGTVSGRLGIGNPWCQDGSFREISWHAGQRSSFRSPQMGIWTASPPCVAEGGVSGNICCYTSFHKLDRRPPQLHILTASCDSKEMTCCRTFDHPYHTGRSLCLCGFACEAAGFFYFWTFYHIRNIHILWSVLFLCVFQCGGL